MASKMKTKSILKQSLINEDKTSDTGTMLDENNLLDIE
jgi:hypothetical protein